MISRLSLGTISVLEAARVGLVGVAHSHVWHILDTLKQSSLGTLVAASVENKPLLRSRRERLLKEYGMGKIYDDYAEMLDHEALDVVFNYSDHILRAPVTEKAASKGLHVMLEKPMAYNLSDAEAMLAASKKHKVNVMVNWPTAWSPVFQKAYAMITEGAVGEIFHIRNRSGHDLPQRETMRTEYNWQWMATKGGGGAYMDFCCYGVALARWIMGMPEKVYGVTGNFVKPYLASNDNGLVVMTFSKGTAMVEGSWSSIGTIPGGPEIYGTKGSLLLGWEEPLRVFSIENPRGAEVEAPPLPVGRRNAVEYFLTRTREGKSIEGLCSPEFSRDVQEILEAGLISASTGKAVSLPISKT